METEAPLSSPPLFPPSLLPSSCSLSPALSLLLPNASWLCLNISPPRFLAPALGALTKRRRASSPSPCRPSLLPPSEEPLWGWEWLCAGTWALPSGLGQGGTGLAGEGAGGTRPGSLGCSSQGDCVAWLDRRTGMWGGVGGHRAGVSGFWWGWQASVRRSCAQNSELRLPPLLMWLRQPGRGRRVAGTAALCSQSEGRVALGSSPPTGLHPEGSWGWWPAAGRGQCHHHH